MTRKRTYVPVAAMGTLVIAAAVTFPVQASRHDGDLPARMERHIERMAERLALEDDQIDLVRPILEGSRARARAIHAGSAADRRDVMEALRSETDAQLAEVLTPAQMEQLTAMRETRRERRSERRKQRAEERFDALAERLQLAASQVEPVREILAASRADGRAFFDALREENLERDEMRARSGENGSHPFRDRRAAGRSTDASADGSAGRSARREAERAPASPPHAYPWGIARRGHRGLRHSTRARSCTSGRALFDPGACPASIAC